MINFRIVISFSWFYLSKMLAEAALEALAQSGDIRIEREYIYPVA